MARPRLTNLNYFPLNVDFFEDDKIQLIEADYGLKGVIIALKLLCKIYKEKGYYYQWGDDQCLLFAKKAGEGIRSSLVSEVVQGLVRRGFFDKTVFDSFNVLTSKGIQERYIKALERTDLVEIKKELLCKNVEIGVNVTLIGIDVTKINVNDASMPQRKGKERKEKKRKEHSGQNLSDLHEPESIASEIQIINFEEFKNYFNEHRGNMPEFQTISDARKIKIKSLLKKFSKEKIAEAIQIANKSDFLQGNNPRSFICSIDWILNPTNFLKILEGNYNNQNKKNEYIKHRNR